MDEFKYLVKSKGRRLVCRDGTEATDPVFELTPKIGWVPFVNLPGGVGLEGDGDLSVKEIVTTKDLEGLAERKPFERPKKPEPAAKEADKAEDAQAAPAPSGGRARLAGSRAHKNATDKDEGRGEGSEE